MLDQVKPYYVIILIIGNNNHGGEHRSDEWICGWPPTTKKKKPKLHTYAKNQSLNHLLRANVDSKSQHYQLMTIVAAGEGPDLLGRNWLNTLKLDWIQIFYLEGGMDKPWQQVVDKYPDVFQELGTMKGVKTHI